MTVLKAKLEKAGIEVQVIGIGSTPSCSHKADYSAINEIHPGAYVFYDAQQMRLGSCDESDVAIRVSTTILAHFPNRNELLVDCGFTAITKQGYDDLGGSFVLVEGYENLKLHTVTQEVGRITTRDGTTIKWDEFPIGSVLMLIPYHSCATASVHPHYFVHENGIVKAIWKPAYGW